MAVILFWGQSERAALLFYVDLSNLSRCRSMTVRINIRRLAISVLLSFLVPVTLAILIDWQLGLFPWLTIGASIIFIPLSTFIVIRAALAEMDQLIQAVAPLPEAANE